MKLLSDEEIENLSHEEKINYSQELLKEAEKLGEKEAELSAKNKRYKESAEQGAKRVKQLNDQGVTIILTTHYLEEAEEMCDQIAIINHGQIVANEEKSALMKRLNQTCVEIMLNKKPKASLFKGLDSDIKISDKSLSFKHSPSCDNLDKIMKLLVKEGYNIQDLNTYKPGLEEVFLSIVGEA